MKKYNKKDYINIFILASFFLLFLITILISQKNCIYGSKLDYVDQHYIIPEYFRNLFYETKQLFPSFALNIGMGQNIYNFSYYGLYSPIILISYLLPFIKMVNYIQIISILIILVDILLFYKWISNHFENKTIRFLTTFIFIAAAPLLFHSHRHIMFVNYMPFLILGLIGVDNYFNKNKKILLMISVLLIVLTNYYFSVPALLSLLIYGIYIYLKNNKQITFKKFIKEGSRFLINFIVPILISSILLLPTFAAILNNRLETNNSLSILNMLIPQLSLKYMLYGSYTLGLTSILIFALSNGLILNKKEYKFLSIVFLLITFFPIVNYILNVGMYLNGKVFIPFIPLAIILIGKLLKDVFDNKIKTKTVLIVFLIISILGLITFNNKTIYIIDSMLVLVGLITYMKTKYKKLLSILIIVISIANVLLVNIDDEFATKNQIDDQYNKEINELINNNDISRTYVEINKNINDANNIRTINEYKTTMYSSLTNKYYNNFYWNEIDNNNPYRNSTIISGTNNIIYNIYTGTKYIISKNQPSIGYQIKSKNKSYNLYQNNNAFSVIYANKKLMSKNEYQKLSYPYNIETLMNYTIIDKDIDSGYKTKIEKINLNNLNKKYVLNFKENTKKTIELNNDYKNKIIFIRFVMNYSQSCQKPKGGDTYITINNIKNTLTCKSWKYHNKNYTFDYVITSTEDLKTLDIEIAKGKYIISDIQMYTLDYNEIKKINNNHDNITIDKSKTKGDEINGTINVKEKSYLNITIPYDKGFKIFVDNKNTKYELINKSFIGFEIKPGIHKIKIKYNAPLLKEAKILSIIGLVLFGIITVTDARKEVKNEKNINDNTLF